MIEVDSTIQLNYPEIEDLIAEAAVALEQTAEALHTDVVQEQVMPRDTGNLQNESTYVDYSKKYEGKISLVSSTPYARRMYFHPEYHFQKTENGNAKGRWYGAWISGKKKDFCQNVFAEIYRRLTGL